MYFLLLVFKISLNLGSDISYKQNRFSKILSEKNLKFIPNRRGNSIAFDLSLVLLPIEIDLIIKEKSWKENIFTIYGNGYIKIIFTLLIKVVAYYV